MKNREGEYRTPGQLLLSVLKEKGWTQKVLAVVLGVDEAFINKIVNDKRPISAELALVLEEVLQISADQLLDIQKSYELAKAKITVVPDSNRATRAQLFADLPIPEMIKRGWLDVKDVRDMTSVESALSRFFGIDSVSQLEVLPYAAKKTDENLVMTPRQVAWFYRVRQIANEMLVAPYSEQKVRDAIPKLKKLLSAPEEARHVPRILMECGIRFVIVEGLKSSKIDGICFWLDENSPVIGMTLRFDRMDNFWFVLRHELEHVLQKHGQGSPKIDIDLNGDSSIDKEERIANEASADFCAPQARIDSFIARKAPLFSERDFLGLAKVLGIHPCMVAGQIQFKTGRYSLFRNYLVKIRQAVLPNAIVDGWGDIAPVDVN